MASFTSSSPESIQFEKTTCHSLAVYAAPYASEGAKVSQHWRSESIFSAVKSMFTFQVTAELPPAN